MSWKDRVYGLYENSIMASRLGRFRIFYRLSELLFDLLFKNEALLTGIIAEAVPHEEDSTKLIDCPHCGEYSTHVKYRLSDKEYIYICEVCWEESWNDAFSWTWEHDVDWESGEGLVDLEEYLNELFDDFSYSEEE